MKRPAFRNVLLGASFTYAKTRRAYSCGPSADEVLQDVELVWSNCRLYNTSEGSEILVLLARAERLFQSLWQKAGLSLKAEGQTGSAGRAPQEETVITAYKGITMQTFCRARPMY